MTPRPSASIARIDCSIAVPLPPFHRRRAHRKHIDGVHAHQHRAALGEIALDERQVLARLDRRLVDVRSNAPAADVSTVVLATRFTMRSLRSR